jgi:hypothetical protein
MYVIVQLRLQGGVRCVHLPFLCSYVALLRFSVRAVMPDKRYCLDGSAST